MDLDRLKLLTKQRLEESDLNKAPIYCDIDNTLILWNLAGTMYIPNQPVIEALRFMHETDMVEIVLWSAAGVRHCKDIAKELGLEDIVSAYLTKPCVCIDDMKIDAQFTTHIYPQNT